jgi:hypothetical protein
VALVTDGMIAVAMGDERRVRPIGGGNLKQRDEAKADETRASGQPGQR